MSNYFKITQSHADRFHILSDPHAGGFRDKLQGGLYSMVALSAISENHRQGHLPQPPFSVSSKLSDSVAPGQPFSLAITTGDGVVRSDFYTEGSSDIKASVKFKPLDQGTVPKRVLLPHLSSSSLIRSFSCIDSCVVMGSQNPVGLKLHADYISAEGALQSIFGELPLPQSPEHFLESAFMYLDELEWWMGLALSGKIGVTRSLEYTVYEFPKAGEAMVARVEHHDSTKIKSSLITNIPGIVYAGDRILIEASFSYAPIAGGTELFAGQINPDLQAFLEAYLRAA